MGLKSSLPLGMVTCFPPKESIFPPVVITRLLLGWCFCTFLDGALPNKNHQKYTTGGNLRVVYHLFSGGGWSTKLQACRRLRLCHDLCWAVWCGGLPFGEMMTWAVNSWILGVPGALEKLRNDFLAKKSGVKELFSRVIQHEKQY